MSGIRKSSRAPWISIRPSPCTTPEWCVVDRDSRGRPLRRGHMAGEANVCRTRRLHGLALRPVSAASIQPARSRGRLDCQMGRGCRWGSSPAACRWGPATGSVTCSAPSFDTRTGYLVIMLASVMRNKRSRRAPGAGSGRDGASPARTRYVARCVHRPRSACAQAWSVQIGPESFARSPKGRADTVGGRRQPSRIAGRRSCKEILEMAA